MIKINTKRGDEHSNTVLYDGTHKWGTMKPTKKNTLLLNAFKVFEMFSCWLVKNATKSKRSENDYNKEIIIILTNTAGFVARPLVVLLTCNRSLSHQFKSCLTFKGKCVSMQKTTASPFPIWWNSRVSATSFLNFWISKNSNTIVRKIYLSTIYMSAKEVPSKYLTLCFKLIFTVENEREVSSLKSPTRWLRILCLFTDQ